MTSRASTDWILVILLFVAGLFAAGQFAKISLSLGALAEVYPGRDGVLPLAVSMVSLTGIIFGATAGAIVARVGVRKVLLAALIAGALLSLAQATLPPFLPFMALRLLEGAAHLAIVVSAPTLMAAVAVPRDKPVVMGLWGTFFGIGFALTAILAPAVIARFGAGGVFAAHGAGLLVLALALAPRLPRGVAKAEAAGGWIERHLAIYRNPRRIAPALGFVFHTLTFISLLTYLPRWLGPWSGPVLPLIALVGTFGAGYLARALPPARIVQLGFALGAGLMLVLIAVPEGWRVAVTLPLFVAIGLVPGASFALVPALNEDSADQALAQGAVAQMGNIGTATSTPIFALTLGAGLAGTGLLFIALSLAGLVVVTLVHRRVRRS
ncbi:MFS transporter [Anianabacter salinae]|uniref:MFS transporter n=1 Tax=Anianabacter salinae TaxID=2851023 RepID=UPI00225E0729|nr:MFS transporter [Anianabacter salinae]MBV0911699.1 MFS transporter [Anianabacter salinae]